MGVVVGETASGLSDWTRAALFLRIHSPSNSFLCPCRHNSSSIMSATQFSKNTAVVVGRIRGVGPTTKAVVDRTTIAATAKLKRSNAPEVVLKDPKDEVDRGNRVNGLQYAMIGRESFVGCLMTEGLRGSQAGSKSTDGY